MLTKRAFAVMLFAIGAVLVFTMLELVPRDSEEVSGKDEVVVSEVLGSRETTSGYARAFEPREFSFPRDHGPHPAFKSEWWYFTGNLETPTGRHFGYQLTFFRTALAPPQKIERESNWATHQLYTAHFTVTDVQEKDFHYFERFSRGAVGLAGATTRPFKVWLEDWKLLAGTQVGSTQVGSIFPLTITAAQDGIAIELKLTTNKPVILQGDKGLQQISGEAGNAFYYYSFTRLLTKGTIRINGQSFPVSGTSWMDHEWGTSALSKEQEGWDWFALQLPNNTELMFYFLRKKDGTAGALSAGTFIYATGETRKLSLAQLDIEVTDWWQSPHSGIRYPSGWRLSAPVLDLSLTITPLLKDQELNLSARYWEGAVRCSGTYKGSRVTGVGYVELVGYGRDASLP